MLIPNSKHDLEAIEALYETNIELINEQLPELLVWLQDINWPVAGPLAAFLSANFAVLPAIESHILEVLKGNDAVWKYWLIICLDDLFSQQRLMDCLSTLAYNPSRHDRAEEVYIVALDALINKLSRAEPYLNLYNNRST